MSELWARKVRTYFKHFDFDGDGFISKKDLEEMSDNYCDAKKATDAQREQTKQAFMDVWRIWNKFTGEGDNGMVTSSILIESFKQQRNDPEFKASYLRLCYQYFILMDLDGDGYLQEEECVRGFDDLGFQDVSFIHKAFESMDLNQDGKVSWKEYSTAIFEYLTSEDENSPYTLIFGPLV